MNDLNQTILRNNVQNLTPTLSGSDIVYAVGMAAVQPFYKNLASKMKYFSCQGFFYLIFDSKNCCKNELKDNNEKLCS